MLQLCCNQTELEIDTIGVLWHEDYGRGRGVLRVWEERCVESWEGCGEEC